jgi:hypothetical protein
MGEAFRIWNIKKQIRTTNKQRRSGDMKTLASLLIASLLIGTLAGCGGGGSSSSAAPSSGTATGVSTPSKVSIVNTK